MSFMDEIRKIPPVTRFLCGSSLAVSLPVMMQVVSPYKVLFVKELVMKNLEIWRVPTSFFLGSSGINYIFDFAMLYRNTSQVEAAFAGRTADYAWQLVLACASILALNIPLGSFIHARPMLVALTYLSARLAPPGTQTSIFGLLTVPLVYFPYILVGLDLIMAGPAAAATSVTGAVAGHLWWWGVFESRALEAAGRAPRWLVNLLGNGDGVGGGNASSGAAGGPAGVHVIPPRRLRESTATSGHSWGSGQRLGEH